MVQVHLRLSAELSQPWGEAVFQSFCPCPHVTEAGQRGGCLEGIVQGVFNQTLFSSVSQPCGVDMFHAGVEDDPMIFCAVLVICCRSFLSSEVQLENHNVRP